MKVRFKLRSLMLSVLGSGVLLAVVLAIVRSRLEEYALTHDGAESIWMEDYESVGTGDVIDRILGISGRTRFASLDGQTRMFCKQMSILHRLTRLRSLSFLGATDDCQSASGAVLPAVVKLRFSHCSKSFIRSMIPRVENVEEIEFYYCEDLEIADLADIGQCQRLAKCIVNGSPLLSGTGLVESLSACTRLKHIELVDCENDFEEIFVLLKRFHQMEYVCLKGHEQFVDVDGISKLDVSKKIELLNVEVDPSQIARVRGEIEFQVICLSPTHTEL